MEAILEEISPGDVVSDLALVDRMVSFTIEFADDRILNGKAMVADVYHHPIERTLDEVCVFEGKEYRPIERRSTWDITLRGVGELTMVHTE